MGNYLYNGLELPPLPEWDKNIYPYAMLRKYEVTAVDKGLYHAIVYFMSEPSFYRKFSSFYKGGAVVGKTQSYQWINDELLTEYNIATGISELVTEANKWIKTDEAEYTEEDNENLINVTWSNHGIPNPSDGTVYLAASYPIDAETGEEITIYGLNGATQLSPALPSAIMLGFQTGTATRLMRKKLEPVAYLYGPNKVRLPEIPAEVTAYPHVVVQYLADGTDTILAYGYETEPYVEFYKPSLSGDSYDRLRIDSGETRAGNWYSTEPDEWFVVDPENVTDATLGYHTCKLSNIVWANFDIYASDGTLYMPKTDPEPVYE